jgi:hypothetical protein
MRVSTWTLWLWRSDQQLALSALSRTANLELNARPHDPQPSEKQTVTKRSPSTLETPSKESQSAPIYTQNCAPCKRDVQPSMSVSDSKHRKTARGLEGLESMASQYRLVGCIVYVADSRDSTRMQKGAIVSRSYDGNMAQVQFEDWSYHLEPGGGCRV